MTDFFLQIGLSNACFSLALAIVAMVVGAKGRRPHVAHLLWLLVFVKLVTPPIVSIPIVTIAQQHESTAAINSNSQSPLSLAGNREFDVDEKPNAWGLARIGVVALRHGKEWFPPIWLLGSVVVFGWSMVRVSRFGRLLAAESEVAPQQLQTAAAKIARRLGLNRIPTIYTTSTRLSPLVWWAGGKVRIVIPTVVIEKMEPRQSQWILAHELAHVRRRDYLVRWLEWLACVCFWWNPVVWWAQRNLRATEEICCDALVLSSMHPKPQSYANSILKAVESIACPTLRPPAVASEINSGGFLERRFKMIVSNNPNRLSSRWLQVCVLLCAMVVLPLGIASAHNYEAVGKRLEKSVKKGEITQQQADAMMATLKKNDAKKDDAKKDTDYEAIGKKIKPAAQAGKKTKKEGPAKMAAIKKGDAKKDSGSERAYLAKVKKELGEAVEVSKISTEDAAKKYEAAEKGIRERTAMAKQGKRGVKERDPKADYEAAVAKIKAAIEAGEITEEQGKARLEGMKERLAGQGDRGKKSTGREDGGKKDVDWEGIKKRIEGAVKSGRITREEADAQYEAIKKRMAGEGEPDSEHISREDYNKAAGEIHKAIAEGKLTKEEGREKLAAIRKMIGEKSEAGTWKKSREGEAKKDVDWEGIKKRIEGAVKSGDMTREEADVQYEAVKKRMAGDSKRIGRDDYSEAAREIREAVAEGKLTKEAGREKLAAIRKMIGEKSEAGTWKKSREGEAKKDVDWEGIKKRIEGAVKSGDMTREEAEAKYEAIKKRMAGSDKR